MRIAFAFLATCGCATDPISAIGAQQHAVIYGSDDREEVYAHSNGQLRTLAVESVAALFPVSSLIETSDGILVDDTSLSDAIDVCIDERFANQPAIASCSSTLVENDLVLTAGHCVVDEEDCANTRFVFDYYYESDGVLAPISSADVFRCRRVVAREVSEEPSRDYALIQLDRPATEYGRRVASVRRDDIPVQHDLSIAVLGFPSGTPLKIDDGGHVVDRRKTQLDYFLASTDTFGGSSGGGAFDPDGVLVGSVAGGNQDYVRDGDCYRANQLADETAGGTSFEHIAYVARALEGLCGSGWPSVRLCGTEGVCGDDACTDSEDAAMCPADCGADAELDSYGSTTGCGLTGRLEPDGFMVAVLVAAARLLSRARRRLGNV